MKPTLTKAWVQKHCKTPGCADPIVKLFNKDDQTTKNEKFFPWAKAENLCPDKCNWSGISVDPSLLSVLTREARGQHKSFI
jgi:hypothetical protein